MQYQRKTEKSLKDTGCMVITRNLLKSEMTKDELLSYLKDRSLQEWFNPNAPKIKSGEIYPKDFSLQEAIELLLHEPILIRRPLLSINGHRMCGFDPKAIEHALGFSLKDHPAENCSLSNKCLSPITSTTFK